MELFEGGSIGGTIINVSRMSRLSNVDRLTNYKEEST